MRTRKGGSAFPKCPRMEWLPALMTMTDHRAASSVVGYFQPALSPPTRPHTCLMVALRALVLNDTTAATRHSHWTISCSTARRLLSRLGDSCKYRTAFCSRATCRNRASQRTLGSDARAARALQPGGRAAAPQATAHDGEINVAASGLVIKHGIPRILPTRYLYARVAECIHLQFTCACIS